MDYVYGKHELVAFSLLACSLIASGDIFVLFFVHFFRSNGFSKEIRKIRFVSKFA